MNNIYCEKIAALICSVARREDAELMKISNKGIMNCPELAFVYSVAKDLSMMSHQIFGQASKPEMLEWSLEKSITDRNINRLDLYINPKLLSPNDGIIPIEFKLGYEVSEWEEDVDKLIRINGKNLCKIFCAIITVPQGIDAEKNPEK
jgi:hypothetical protein